MVGVTSDLISETKFPKEVYLLVCIFLKNLANPPSRKRLVNRSLAQVLRLIIIYEKVIHRDLLRKMLSHYQ